MPMKFLIKTLKNKNFLYIYCIVLIIVLLLVLFFLEETALNPFIYFNFQISMKNKIEDIENEVIKIISKETKIKLTKNNKATKTVLQFRWDSLQHIKIIIAIEKKFKVKIGISAVDKLHDIKSIVNFIKKFN